jgi:uncharacterized lipoprotein YmbA
VTAHRARRALAAAVVSIAAAAGCFGGSPKPEFFALSPASGKASGPPIASLPELGLVVGPLEFPRYLDRPEIVRRDGANRLVVADAHRWGGSLRTDVLRVIADDLGRLLGTARVALYPAEPRFPARYRVLIDLREFEARGESVVLRALWTLADASDGRALAVDESRIEEPIASPATQDVVAAQSAALGGVSRAVAERIAALPAAGAK